MSSNEVGSITNQKFKRQIDTQNQTQSTSDNSTIEVFATDVSTRADLTASEENASLFANTTLRGPSQSEKSAISTSVGIADLPEDIKKQYPTERDQAMLRNLSSDQVEQVRKLMDTKFPLKNIVQIVQLFKPEQIDTLKQEADEMADLAGGKDNIFIMALGNDKYDMDAYVLNSLSYDMTMHSNILNEDLTTRSIEKLTESTTKDGKKFRERHAYDLGSRTLSRTRYDYNEETKGLTVSYEIRSKLKEDGSMVSRELIRPSAVDGIFDIEVLTEEGTQDVSQVKQRKNGKTSIRKDMVSPDGTRTEYIYRDTPDGNRYSRYKITDENGNVLMNNKKSFKVVDENTFKSTFNDESYTMNIKDNVLTVQNDNDEAKSAQIDLSKIEGDKESLIAVLKQMPGDQLIALSKTTDKLVGIESVLESYYSVKDHSIHSGDDMFVVLHEEGHAKDFQTLNLYETALTEKDLISRDEELTEIFEQEKEAFNEAFPDAQREHIDYFINTLTHYSGRSGGLQETVAETNALLESPRSHEMLGMRTQYLQQYFPKTIAKLNTLLSEDRERAEQKFNINVPAISIPEIPKPKAPIPAKTE